MEKETMGTVISVEKQWWFKVNTKPFRKHTFDGAIYPHVIKVRYVVDGTEYLCKKWVRAVIQPPPVGSTVKVLYEEEKPAKAKITL